MKWPTVQPFSQRRRAVVEALLVFVVSMIVMLNGGLGVTRHGANPAFGTLLLLVAVTAGPLLDRRFDGVAVFIVSCAATTVLAIVVYPIGLPLGPAMALYRMASSRRLDKRMVVRQFVAVSVGFIIYLSAATIHNKRFAWSELFHGGLLWALCWFAGERARLRQEQVEELNRHAIRERNLAAAEERIRIARDLHDSAGHAINVIAVRAGAARLRHHEDADRSLAALIAIEDLARHTVADLDQIVGALRTEADADECAVPRSLGSLHTLIALHAETGLQVSLISPPPPIGLPITIDQAAYRIVQEALTNASRHGTGTAVIELDFNQHGLSIRVRNPVQQRTQTRFGHGLIGATERATQLGGTLTTRNHNHVFELQAELPYRSTVGTAKTSFTKISSTVPAS
jgi:signal transduction histidine kinase